MAQQKNTWEVELSDGRVAEVEADHQPTEAEVMQALGLMQAAAPPREGQWVKAGEAITQSELSSDPAKRLRVQREQGWTWQPPPHTGQTDLMATGVPFVGSVGVPEVVVGGVGVGRAALRALPGAGAASGVLAGARTAITQASPFVKYEVARTALEKMGVPPTVAALLAYGASGYTGSRRAPRGRGTPSAAPPTATPPVAALPVTPPVAASPVAPPVVTASPVAPAAGRLSPQRVQNELGIAARRLKATLSEADYKRATTLVEQGDTPMQAVAKVAPAPVPVKLKLSAAETQTYAQLRKIGKSREEAEDLIRIQRELAARLGTPSAETVRQSIAERNIRGEWSK